MPRLAKRIGLRTALAVAALAATNADAAGPPGQAAAPVCRSAGYPGPHTHPGAPARATGRLGPAGASGAIQGDPGPIRGLPRGRRYYGGRYFGSFNNRYYGPQYGYF